jgi:hypothetical protein
VANDLDQVRGGEERMEKIRETVMQSFFDGDDTNKCVAKLLILHLINQRQLEDHMRRSGNGKLFIPKWLSKAMWNEDRFGQTQIEEKVR